MSLLAEAIAWISIGMVIHSYVIFPVFINLRARLQVQKAPLQDPAASQQEMVSILMSAYNEEEVIEEKIISILESDYNGPFEILVGSDCSTDNTNKILLEMEKAHPEVIHFFPFNERQGKPNIINQLVDHAAGRVLVLTDANVIFDASTLHELLQPFSNPQIGLVDTQMVNKGARSSGISIQEKAYISREVSIKHHESQVWGAMMGPFGGCFAIRKELYEPVPENFLVDDFFLNMIVLERGFMAVNNPKAIVYEDVSNDIVIEYRRKIRIATGNFQNLARFKHLLWPPWNGVGFCFLSHKVLRWFGPFLYVTALIPVALLYKEALIYKILLIGLLAIPFIPLVDQLLKKVSIHISFLRFITHFCAMNLAMFVGFLRYRKGVKNNVWQPTKRNQ